MQLMIEKAKTLKAKPTDESKLGFGNIFTDHMLTVVYSPEEGWHDAKIEPYHAFQMDPAGMVLHYGQTIFEGLKAYRCKDGKIRLFRPEQNFMRMNRSAERLCIPQIDVDFMVDALKKLVELEQDWVPSAPGTSLYIRPTIIASDPHLGVRASNHYIFFIILSPVGAYYATGLDPVPIYVEDNYVRAVRGGTGAAKTAANYAASLLAGEEAKKLGYSQVLWLDGVEKKYVEEVGSMNIFFRFNDEVTTPALVGSILPGITRMSVLQLAQDMGYKTTERRISIQEVFDRYDKGELLEVFGTGTAAVISPVGELKWKDRVIKIGDGTTGELSQKLYDTLTGIQYGELPDNHGWITIL